MEGAKGFLSLMCHLKELYRGHIFEEDIFVLRCMITDVNKDQKQSGVLQQLSMNNTTMTHGNHIHQTRICTLLTDWVKLWADGLGGLQTTVGS